MPTAILIFTVTYVFIALGRGLDRPSAAIAGATAMVAFGALGLEQAYASVNLDTIALLFGMMVIAGYLREAAFFRHTAWWVLTRMRTARTLLWALVFVAGGLSALLVNDTICLMFTPLVLAVVEEAGLPPLPYLLALASAANIGSAVTFTGNPQNMLIGMAAKGSVSYLHYVAVALPAGVVGLVLDALLLGWLFAGDLPRGALREHVTEEPHLDRVLAAKGLGALALFVVLAAAGRPLAGAAMVAAAVLMLIGRIPPRRALEHVDYLLLVFFAGLFIVVAGLAHSGALEKALAPLAPVLARGDLGGTVVFAVITVVASNIVSNVPFVLVALPVMHAMPRPAFGYVVLAFASTLAGNLTTVGSVANLIVLEGVRGRVQVGFVRFLRVGFVVTGVTLTAALAILWCERLLGLL